MNHRDAAGLAFAVVVYAAVIACAWLAHRRTKERIRREKTTGRLPARRSLPTPSPVNPARQTTVLLFGAFLWTLCPLVAWFLAGNLMRLLTPPSARGYLPPFPPFSEVLRTNLYWCLFWAGLAILPWAAARLSNVLIRRLADPAVSKAEELIKAGDLEAAVGELRRGLDSDGPSVARWNTLADALMKQERWSEALKISLDIADRRRFDLQNRRRKALALCKLGFSEIALFEFDRWDTTPERLSLACSYCHALIDLGLFDRAWDQLRRAEVMYGRRIIPKTEAPHARKQIDACRARLAEHFVEDKPRGFDEL